LEMAKLWSEKALDFIKEMEFIKIALRLNPNLVESDGDSIIRCLLNLCAIKQENLVKEYIENESEIIQNFFKPVYYLTLKRLNDLDFKRIPEELIKVVEDLENEVEKLSNS
jgi:hypothetical protein